MSSFRIARDIRPDPTPKTRAVKSKGYLEFIRQLPSIISGRTPVEACHVSFANTEYCHYGRGRGTKAHDAWCLPMTSDEHRSQHSMDEQVFWWRLGINPHELCVVLFTCYSTLGDEAVKYATAKIMARTEGAHAREAARAAVSGLPTRDA